MLCTECGKYYKKSVYNNTNTCEDCVDCEADIYPSKEDVESDVGEVLYKDGSYTVKPVFYD
jgi:hypothetical protein